MVPRALRVWFVVHFVADLLVALPLFVAPVATLTALGFATVDPVATRLVAAALFAIGVQSLLGRDEGPEVFRAMLTLKLIWSGSATAGLLIGALAGAPAVTWAFLAIFAAFHVLWWRYRITLARPPRTGGLGGLESR